MAAENKSADKTQQTWYYRKCQKCNSKMHADRKYCICGTEIDSPFYETESQPKIYEKRNLDLPFYSCEACGAGCSYCASYSMSTRNSAGFGGPDCRYRTSDIRCACCQLMIKKAAEYPEINKALEETFSAIQRILKNRECAA